jgi:nitroreductase
MRSSSGRLAASSLAISVIAIAGYFVQRARRRSGDKEKDDGRKLEEIIARRRTIPPADYDQERKVPKEYIQRILEAANWAPTHGKTEPWRFVVFSNEESRRELGLKYAELYKEQTPPEFFQERKYTKKITSITQSSHVISIGMKRQESQKIPMIEEAMAVACAVQNMMLVATDLDVVTYWHSSDALDSKDMHEYLGLEGEHDRCFGILHMGFSTKPHPQGFRKSIDGKVKWI